MGTTVVSALMFDNKIAVAHVGDSRMYRLRGDKFEQITMDHSLLQELVDRGFYSPEEAQRGRQQKLCHARPGRRSYGRSRDPGDPDAEG